MYIIKITGCLSGKHRVQSTLDSQAIDKRTTYGYLHTCRCISMEVGRTQDVMTTLSECVNTATTDNEYLH